MITNPFVYIETQPYQEKGEIQGIKMDLSTLIICKNTTENFQRDFNNLYPTPKITKINQARPLIYIMRPQAS